MWTGSFGYVYTIMIVFCFAFSVVSQKSLVGLTLEEAHVSTNCCSTHYLIDYNIPLQKLRVWPSGPVWPHRSSPALSATCFPVTRSLLSPSSSSFCLVTLLLFHHIKAYIYHSPNQIQHGRGRQQLSKCPGRLCGKGRIVYTV